MYRDFVICIIFFFVNDDVINCYVIFVIDFMNIFEIDL